MVRFQRVGFIIYKNEKEDKFRDIFNRFLKEYESSIKIISSSIGQTSILKEGWILQSIKDVFKDYNSFDNFLYSFSREVQKDKEIIVLGHTDETGFLWTDYN